MSATYVYTRVSSLAQGAYGRAGEATQLEHCLQYWKLHEINAKLPPLATTGPTGPWYSDQISTQAKFGKGREFASRQGARSLLAKMMAGDHLIVYSVCRLGRSMSETLAALFMLERRGINVHVSSQPGLDPSSTIGKIILSVLAGLANLDNDYRSERCAMAAAHNMAAGRTCGPRLRAGLRFKDKDDWRFEECEREKALCGLIVEYGNRGLPLFAMWSVLRAHEIKRADGAAQKGSRAFWTRHRLRRVLKSAGVDVGPRKNGRPKKAAGMKELKAEFERRVAGGQWNARTPTAEQA